MQEQQNGSLRMPSTKIHLVRPLFSRADQKTGGLPLCYFKRTVHTAGIDYDNLLLRLAIPDRIKRCRQVICLI
jgi:hypothetical protein